ncbi:hypothetical protein FRB98_003332 [Tulasnella sp. 332]|nr:hypothetical protein FRB98_003332 [Tulasnella sp. 332]
MTRDPVRICLPLDDERPLGEADMRMLGIDSGDVFTKFDGLETRALNRLRREGRNMREAFRAMTDAAEQLFKTFWLDRIYTSSPPIPPFVRLKGLVRLQLSAHYWLLTLTHLISFIDLHKSTGHCNELTECTAELLKDNKPLQKMFIMAQNYELEPRLRYAVPDAIKLLLETRDQKASCALVADHCFWITDRDANDRTSSGSIQRGLKLAMKAYRDDRQEAVMGAVVEAFPGADSLSLQSFRKGKHAAAARETKESELSEKLLAVVMQYRLSKKLQPAPQDPSPSVLPSSQ